jgi:hypothetical protein
MDAMKTHWLYGRGPDKALDFQREVDVETNCMECTHREVCGKDMEKRCENYVFGSSSGRDCQGCGHKYTRYDKDPVPCFSCPWFEAKSATPAETIDLARKVAAETGVTDSNGALARLFARALMTKGGS